MRIGLIDVDGHRYPNLPLMKLSAWHKEKGDAVVWYEPLFHNVGDPFDVVYMSKVFSFSPDYPYGINCKKLVRGGSGYAIELVNGKEVYNKENDIDLPYEIEHIYPDYSIYPEYTQDTAFGFLTRGCHRKCSFCHVFSKEGCSHKVADLSEFWRGQKNIVLCDPNILACKEHIVLLQQLVDSKAKVEFNQGIDIRLVNDDNLELLQKIRLDKIHIAYDRYQDKKVIEQKIRMFCRKTGYDRNHGRLMCYILVNYDTSLSQDVERIQFCRDMNISPYPMIYDKKHCDPVYRKLQRWCNNVIFWKVPTFEEYNKEGWKNADKVSLTRD